MFCCSSVFSNRKMSLKEGKRWQRKAPFGLGWRKFNSSSRGSGNVGNAFLAFSKEEGKSPLLVFGDFPSSVISTALWFAE